MAAAEKKIEGVVGYARAVPLVRTASTYLGGKRPVLKITLISCLEEDRRITAVGSLRPTDGGRTVHGASSTEKSPSMGAKCEIGSSLVLVAQS